jgi:hypothetical protein
MHGDDRNGSARLAAARRRVKRWRARRGGRGIRIPEEFWHEAVEIARIEGVVSTARALRLAPERLAARMTGASEQALGRGQPKSEFVELEAQGWDPVHRAVLRLESADGDVLCMEVTGPSAVDLASVVQAFRNRRP